MVLPQVAQGYIIGQILFHGIGGCLGEKHLSTMSGVHNASGPVHIQTNVAFMS